MELYKKLKEFGTVKTDVLLSKKTTFKIGGPAKFWVTCDTVDQAVSLLQYLDGEGTPYFIFGGGSNMLARDDGFDGVVVQIADKSVRIEGTMVTAAAGVQTVALSRETMNAGLTGFEWGVGVPGTIGGAVRGNAGATGGEMTDVVSSVEVYRDGELITLLHDECDFGYRHSVFKTNTDVVLRVKLSLERGENKESLKQALEYIKYRNETQPQGFASTGCIFKNHEVSRLSGPATLKLRRIPPEFINNGKIPAGWLVEQVGMKGVKQGNAQVSERHGNFIVNLGDATAADVLKLIEQVKEKVYNEYGIELHEEIQII